MKQPFVIAIMGMMLPIALSAYPGPTPESQGVSSGAIHLWANSLEAKGLSPQCYVIFRHGVKIAHGEWGRYSISAPMPLDGLTRILGHTASAIAWSEGFVAEDEHLLGLLKRLDEAGEGGIQAGDELGYYLEEQIGESPAEYLNIMMLNGLEGLQWHWGGMAGSRGEFRFGTGAWMQPHTLARVCQTWLGNGFAYKRRYFPHGWGERHPVGTMAYDGNLLAVLPEQDAVVVLFTGSDDNDALIASVKEELLTAFYDSALPENPAAQDVLWKNTRREYKGEGADGPKQYPTVTGKATFGKEHAILEMPPVGKVGRNSEADIVKLKDGRLLLAWSQMLGSTSDNASANIMKRYSTDNGKTWSEESILVKQPEGALNVMCVNFLRLASGDLALFYLHKQSENDCRPVMRVSKDEGETWSEARQIIPDEEVGYFVLNNAQTVQLTSGRLIVPTAISGYSKKIPTYYGERNRGGGVVLVWYSDDEGLTWHHSDKPVHAIDERGFTVRAEEPGVFELKDGRLAMHFRTDDDYQYIAYSSDGGRTWTESGRSTMRSPRTPATVERLSDGRLYAVWNDQSRDPDFRFRMPYFNGECCPMTLGVSDDDGQTWRPILDLEREGHFCYPFLREIDGFLYIGYCCEIGMKTQRVVKIPFDDVRNLPTLPGADKIEDISGEARKAALAASQVIVQEDVTTRAFDGAGARMDQVEGFTRYNFTIDGCEAWVMAPVEPLPGNPWIWGMEFPFAFKERTGVVEMVRQGFFYAHIVVGNNFACPDSMKHFDEFWKEMVRRGLAYKCTPVGISRGGLYGMRFAIQHPDRINCVYGDAPVCDFKSWPGGTGVGKGSPDDWAHLIKVYGFKDEADAIDWKGNPISNLAPLARKRIPLIFVVGDDDDIVPPCENAELVEQRYKGMGGTVHMFHKPGCGHHPHGLEDPTPVIELIRKYTMGE